eukprot:2686206-Alexandrium_andersonii.AAC.1
MADACPACPMLAQRARSGLKLREAARTHLEPFSSSVPPLRTHHVQDTPNCLKQLPSVLGMVGVFWRL